MSFGILRTATPKTVVRSGPSFALAALLLIAAAVRIWLIRHFPEPDADAAGHLGMARAVLADPANVAIHWVYLPAYHFFLATLLIVGFTADKVRLLNCVFAAFVPVVVLKCAETPSQACDPVDRVARGRVPWLAAMFCAVSPLINLLGTSAQQETLFTLLVLGAVWSINRGRYVLAGLVLAVASLIRYEAWGAIGLIVGLRGLGAFRALRRDFPSASPARARCPRSSSCRRFSRSPPGSVRTSDGRASGSASCVSCTAMRTCSATICTAICSGFPSNNPCSCSERSSSFCSCSGSAALGVRATWSRSASTRSSSGPIFATALSAALGITSRSRPFVAIYAAHGTLRMRPRWRGLAIVAATSQLLSLSAQLLRWTWPSLGATVAHAVTTRSEPGVRERVALPAAVATAGHDERVSGGGAHVANW